MKDSTFGIQVRDLAKGFEGNCVLRRVNCDLPASVITALIGANGVGKSTLLRCLAGLTRPDRGRITVKPWGTEPSPATWLSSIWHRVMGEPSITGRECRAVDRRLVGFVSHENQLYPNLTLRENLVFASRLWGIPTPQGHVSGLLRNCRLDPRAADHLPAQVSQGTRQRYSIVRALIHDPRIVLLDEPFANLDQHGRSWLANLLHALKQRDCVILFTSHDYGLVETHADRVIELRAGSLRERADWETVQNDSAIERLTAECGEALW